MIVPLDKPGTPEELLHFGVKGMRWGVRKSETSDSSASTSNQGMSTKKKVAIGVGVGAAVVGVAATAYVLRKHGHTRYIKMGNFLPSKESEAYKSLIRKGREEALRISEEAKRTSRPLPMNVEKRRKLLNVGTKVSSNVEKRRKNLGPKIHTEKPITSTTFDFINAKKNRIIVPSKPGSPISEYLKRRG